MGAVNFGIDLSSSGPRVIAGFGGRRVTLDMQRLTDRTDPWVVPVFTAQEKDETSIPEFRTIKSLLGRTEGLNFSGQRIRKPHFTFKELFARLGRIAHEGFAGQLGEVVISVSAFYQEKQRHFLLECAKKAGVDSVHLIDDNLAAALAHLDSFRNENLLLVNFGFESVEVASAILAHGRLNARAYEQSLAAAGCALTGVLMKSVLMSLESQQTRTILESFAASDWMRFFDLAESGKHKLTLLEQHEILLDRELTGFEDIIAVKFSSEDVRNLFHRAFEDVRKSIDRLNNNNVPDHVLLSGAAARNPYLRELFLEEFDERVLFATDDAVSQGCIGWAASVSSTPEDPTPRLPIAPTRSEEPLEIGALIRGAVEVVDQETKPSRSKGDNMRGTTPYAIGISIRERMDALIQRSQLTQCEELIKTLEGAVVEYRHKLASQPVPTSNPKESVRGETELPPGYRRQIREFSDKIKRTLEEASMSDSLADQWTMLEQTIGLSHEIEYRARHYGDRQRLTAVVNVHSKAAELLMTRADWDGSHEGIFMPSRKWLLCGLQTVRENGLTELHAEIRDDVAELDCLRIQFLIKNGAMDAAEKLRDNYANHFGAQDSKMTQLNELLRQAGFTSR